MEDELAEIRLGLKLAIRTLRKVDRGDAVDLAVAIGKLVEIDGAARRRENFKGRAQVKSGLNTQFFKSI